jgi:hypothetical protein
MSSGKYLQFTFSLQNWRPRLLLFEMFGKTIINLLHTYRCVFWDLKAVGCEGERRVELDQNRALWQASVFALLLTRRHRHQRIVHRVSCYLRWGVIHRFKYLTILGTVFPAISSLLRLNHKCSTSSLWGPRCGKLRCLLVFPVTFSVTYLSTDTAEIKISQPRGIKCAEWFPTGVHSISRRIYDTSFHRLRTQVAWCNITVNSDYTHLKAKKYQMVSMTYEQTK